MIKNIFSGMQKNVGEFLKPLPLHPNHITILSALLAASGAYFVFEKNIFGILLIFLSFACDGLDGAVARAKNLSSSFGAYLDGMSDRLVEFFALLPLLFDATLMLPSLLLLFFGTCMTSFSKAYASHRGVMDADAAAKMKTILPRTEGVISIFIALIFFVLGYLQYAHYLLWLLAALSIISFIYLQIEACKKKDNK